MCDCLRDREGGRAHRRGADAVGETKGDTLCADSFGFSNCNGSYLDVTDRGGQGDHDNARDTTAVGIRVGQHVG